MTWVYIAMIALLWGIGNVFVKRGLSSLTAWQSYALDAVCIAFPIWMAYGILNNGNLFSITPLAVFAGLLVSVIYALNYYTFSRGDVSITGSVISTYPVVTLILAFIFLSERLPSFVTVGILMTIVGVVIISLPYRKVKIEKWIYLAMITAIGYGITGFLGKLVLNSISNSTYMMILAIAQVIVVLMWKPFVRDPLPRIQWKTLKYSVIGITLLNFGNILYYVALQQGLASLVVPLSTTYVLLMVLLSVLWLKEKVYTHQMVGIGLAVLGIMVVGWFS